ncbi:SWIM zinc finger domain-containing protein [Pseudoflavonifractor sp. MSJ-37]|uniref:SWIM zinc finger family protein n=1 Tax=Pseudoflavonifractor sp. MSJ-37 TaxID=2841531 RepID=UPI001C10B980|nr:SWIM zinc finger family protein [Pseudoflavonifractor sp. MSJ-37]MBU5435007.1 SWIM zinc finger domain-containing protein [Pseudoflavonifractor sp. MSJ-37]
MSLLTSASAASRWRGYEYFKEGRVSALEDLGSSRFRALVAGHQSRPYAVTIDLAHLRQSSCTCPHAAGRKVICKHMVAVFFTVFPEEAARFYADVLREEQEWEEAQADRADKLIQYVRRLKKKDAQDRLLEVLEIGPDWLWDRFLRDYVE